jgi:hypothetical protein
MHNNQNGMILVLAMFMMALLSMIGIASMMTSTTDIEIATGEQQYVETFYRTFSSHVIAGELLKKMNDWDRGLYGKEKTDGTGYESFETINPVGDPVLFEEIDDDTFAFRLLDAGVLQEPFEGVRKTIAGRQFGVWQVDEQDEVDEDELPCPKDMAADTCKEIEANIGKGDAAFTKLWTDVRLVRFGEEGEEITLADIDIDPVEAREQAGGGSEFGSDDLGIGSKANDLIYNIDARSRLFSGNFNKSPSRQALGFRIVK